MQQAIGAMTEIVSTVVRKAVDMAIMAVRKAEIIPPTIVRKAVEVAIVAINDKPKFAAIKHPRPGTKYRQTRQKIQANKYSHNSNKG